MKNFETYMTEDINKPVSVKKTKWKNYLISTVYLYGKYETMVLKEYPNQPDNYDGDSYYERIDKDKSTALIAHDIIVDLVKDKVIK